MKNKQGLHIGIWSLTGALLLFAALYLQKRELPDMDQDEFAYQASDPLPESTATPKVDTAFMIKQNMFHPLRGESLPAVAAPPDAAKQQSPEHFTLTGIFQYGTSRGALIVNNQPAGTTKESVPKRVFRLGDDVGGGYCLQEILQDQVILIRGDDKKSLPLRPKQENTP